MLADAPQGRVRQALAEPKGKKENPPRRRSMTTYKAADRSESERTGLAGRARRRESQKRFELSENSGGLVAPLFCSWGCEGQLRGSTILSFVRRSFGVCPRFSSERFGCCCVLPLPQQKALKHTKIVSGYSSLQRGRLSNAGKKATVSAKWRELGARRRTEGKRAPRHTHTASAMHGTRAYILV